MRILYINHYAGSPLHGMEYRPYYLAREWVRAGHAVQIVAGSFSHVRARQPETVGRPINQSIDGIDYAWLPVPRYSGNGVGRVRNILSFLRQVWRLAPRMVREFRPDVVIASSTYPMDIYVARRIARRAQARLVFEVHDLWPLSPIELSGMSPWHPWALLCQKAENDAYRNADLVVSMLPKVAQHMAAHGLDLRKLYIVPNGISPDEWQGTPEALSPALLAHVRAQREAGRCVVGYAGSHGLPNALGSLLDAAALLADAPIAFLLVGDGLEKARLAKRVHAEGLSNVTLFPPIPKAQIPALLAEFDIAYIGWQRVPIYRFGIAPNKLMDYMMAGCAVLHSVEAGNDPVAEAGCGLTVPPESPSSIAQGLLELAALSVDARQRMGERGRAFVLAHHAYPVLAMQFIDAVQRLDERASQLPDFHEPPWASAARMSVPRPRAADRELAQAQGLQAERDEERLSEAFRDTQPDFEGHRVEAEPALAEPILNPTASQARAIAVVFLSTGFDSADAAGRFKAPDAGGANAMVHAMADAQAAAQVAAASGPAHASAATAGAPHEALPAVQAVSTEATAAPHRDEPSLIERLEPSFGNGHQPALHREAESIASRYARRKLTDRYHLTRPDVWQTWQERQRAMLHLFKYLKLNDLSRLKLLEVGCGTGGNLLDLLRIGFLPSHLSGIELLPERCTEARSRLPTSVALRVGDATQAQVEPASLDIVLAFSVFSSILDPHYQQQLADAMWSWVRPGGGVLWYDFTVNNPRNADVRGVPVKRLKALFPQGRVLTRRVTLAPPLARAATRVHPALYTLFNTLPWLRTHVLAWVDKP